ncbi:MAG: ATP-dependent Clp protease adaptor ClpS [Planctomycetaceae bacterium]
MSEEQENTTVAEPPAETQTKSKPDKDSKTRPKKQPPYAVIVHNDEEHTWEYVIEVLQRVCGHNTEQAYALTSQVHHAGKAAVWTGALEVAELKRDQIRGYGPDFFAEQTVRFPLGVTVEPMPTG